MLNILNQNKFLPNNKKIWGCFNFKSKHVHNEFWLNIFSAHYSVFSLYYRGYGIIGIVME